MAMEGSQALTVMRVPYRGHPVLGHSEEEVALPVVAHLREGSIVPVENQWSHLDRLVLCTAAAIAALPSPRLGCWPDIPACIGALRLCSLSRRLNRKEMEGNG
eukprot:m.50778 g.50778  ORF g.50778 m.50778 type:complete len:103 (-) comp12573_c1_seq2:133-441(-)